MPLLKVGKTKLHYEVRYSERAKKRRIVVTPEKIEIVAPVGESLDDIAKLVQAKRRWIYDKHQQVNENLVRMMDTAPSRFISGANVLYRGRLMKLRVRHRKNCKPSIKYRGGFIVQMPTGSSEDDVRQLVEEWMLKWSGRISTRSFANMVRRLGLVQMVCESKTSRESGAAAAKPM